MYAIDHVVPIIEPHLYARPYAPVPHDALDPRSNDPLILLDSVGVANRSHHARTDGGNWPYHRALTGSRPDTWLRSGAAAKLLAVNQRLREFGFEVFVLDGYRSVECQQSLYDFYLGQARRVLVAPDDDACREYALGFVRGTANFDPANSGTWPAHATGGAVDLTLRSLATGELVDMGARFEDMSETSHNDFYERQLASGAIADDDPRLWHRRLIHWAMGTEDWINSPWVFWHYDWGNPLYVQMRLRTHAQAPAAAWYGYIDQPARFHSMPVTKHVNVQP